MKSIALVIIFIALLIIACAKPQTDYVDPTYTTPKYPESNTKDYYTPQTEDDDSGFAAKPTPTPKPLKKKKVKHLLQHEN